MNPVLPGSSYKTGSSSEGWIKKDVAYIHNGILLSHSTEQNNAICSNMDELREWPTD